MLQSSALLARKFSTSLVKPRFAAPLQLAETIQRHNRQGYGAYYLTGPSLLDAISLTASLRDHSWKPLS